MDLIFTVLSKLTGLGTEALEAETNFQHCLRENMLILVNDIVAFGDVFNVSHVGSFIIIAAECPPFSREIKRADGDSRRRKFIACHLKSSVLNNAGVMWCAKKTRMRSSRKH